MDYSLITSHIIYDIDEIIEMLEEKLDEYVLMEHYLEDQLLESSVILLEDVEIEYDPGDYDKYFKKKYLKDEAENREFNGLLRNSFATSIFINGSLVDIEIQDGRIICLVGSRGELILRTGVESYVISHLFNLSIKQDKGDVLFNTIVTVLKQNQDKIKKGEINPESFSMVSGVCLMAMAKINELAIKNSELYLSHDEMLLFGLALNLAGEYGDQETQSAVRSVMEQIKIYFPEIEHISPESFEPSQKMGKLLEFKRQDLNDNDD